MMDTQKRPSADRFGTSIEHCNVSDKSKLKLYRDAWIRWMNWYEYRQDEPHAIENQLSQMFSYDLTYRAIVSARSSDKSTSASTQAPVLAYLLDQGYIVWQVLAIGKLVDNGQDVLSLLRLFNDIQNNASLLTRENYVAGDGGPYDYEPFSQQAHLHSIEGLFGIQPNATPLARVVRSKYRHERFDILAGTNPTARRREDVIQPAIFSKLESWLESVSIRGLRNLRNKILAHAANAKSRSAYSYRGIKFSQIDEAHRAIVRVERALVDEVLDYGVRRDVIPIAPLNIFEGLEHPYVCKGEVEAMYIRWRELKVERDSWKDTVLKDLTS